MNTDTRYVVTYHNSRGMYCTVFRALMADFSSDEPCVGKILIVYFVDH